MSKLFLRAALAGCAASGLAVAQTPLTPPIHIPPPAPPVTEVITTKPIPAAKQVLKTFDVADLVCPPADSPLAKPGTDRAMIAAAKAFTDVRSEDLLGVIRARVDRACWDQHGGGAKLAVTTDGKALVVSGPEATADAVGACVESLRKLRSAMVKVDMVLVQVSRGDEELAKLLGDKGTACLSAEDFNATMKRLKACGTLEVLSRPMLMLTNQQTGFFQVGQVAPTINGKPVSAPVGVVSRITPDLSADPKTVRLAVEIQHSECVGGKVDCVQTQTHLLVPDGATMAVKVGTREVARKSEMKVPVVGDVPYLGRLFRTVGVSSEKQDVVAVLTVTRVSDTPVATGVYPQPLPPTAVPPPVMMTTAAQPVARVATLPELGRVGVSFNALTNPPTVPPAPAWVMDGQRYAVPAPVTMRLSAPPGVSLVQAVPADRVQWAGGLIGTSLTRVEADDLALMMAAYKQACLAGRTDDAAHIALRMLAKDSTCFGKR